MTLRKLVDESSVARMTLRQHSADKGDLIREVLEQHQSFVIGSITEKLGPMPDTTTRLEGIFGQYGMWFCMLEFTGCLFEHVLAGFGDTWPEVIDMAVRYHDDLLAVMETLLKDAVPANTARRLVGVYAI